MKKNKKIKLMKNFLVVLVAGVLIVMLCALVSAVAVSGVYTDQIPLEIYPGETKSFSLILQNMAGDKDVKFRASVTEGSEIVSLVDENPEYLVPLGSNNVPVGVLVEVPENAEVGTEYMANIEFVPIPIGGAEGGMVQIAFGLSRAFKIKVVEKPAEEQPAPKGMNLGWIVLVIVLVVVIVVVIWFTKSRKK